MMEVEVPATVDGDMPAASGTIPAEAADQLIRLQPTGLRLAPNSHETGELAWFWCGETIVATRATVAVVVHVGVRTALDQDRGHAIACAEAEFITVDLDVLYCCNTEVRVGRLAEDGSGFTGLWTGSSWAALRAELRRGRYPRGCDKCGKFEQNHKWSERYRAFVARVAERERAVSPGSDALARAVARNHAKLLTYKDEYEVARLYTDASFGAALERQFSGDYRLEFHLAPPWLAGKSGPDGRPRKRSLGQWMLNVFRILARMRVLRGTPLDPFGYSADRRLERALIRAYEARIEELLGKLSAENHALVVEIASIPEDIRGYGHVKRAHVEAAREKETELLQALSAGHAPSQAA